jgi:hypothetical protein
MPISYSFVIILLSGQRLLPQLSTIENTGCANTYTNNK